MTDLVKQLRNGIKSTAERVLGTEMVSNYKKG